MAPSVDSSRTRTVSIPFVQGDPNGRLTSDLVEQIEKQGGLRFAHDGGELTLKVTILDDRYDNIGYRHDPKKLRQGGKHKIIPNETRSKILAEVTVTETATQKVLLGPAYILATAEYDHQNYSVDNDINNFSLGQLSDIDTAEDVLDIPLYRNLAREIALYLQHHFNKLSL
ncbi:MAG: LptE-family protein [Chlamydiia bacterium]|nr:LptE-family protein [Chlamydiia bacterium]